MILVYGVILSKGMVPLKASKKFPVVFAEEVQWPLRSCGADADKLSMAVWRAMMVSLIGRAQMACSSASLPTPPLRMTVILVVGVTLEGDVLRPLFFCVEGAAAFAMAAA